MSAHDEYMTRRQARDLARRLARLERKTRSTAAAHADLRNSAIDGGKGLVLKDEQGQEKYRLGTDENGVTAPQYRGGPVPAQPSEPFVDVGGEVVKIQHSGLDVNEDPAPGDFRRAQIHVSQDAVFDPSLSTLAGYLEEADGSFTHRLPGGEWYVGVVWETLSSRQSVMSDTVLADIPPLVDTQDLEDTLAAAEEKLNTYRDEVAQPRFEALETGLSENTTNLDDARTRLSAAEQTLSPLPGRIESAEQDVATAQVEATKAAAAAVEANNRAMTRLANGNFESDLLYWDHDNVELTSTAHSGQQAAQIGGWLRPGSSFPVVADQIWELSLYYQYDVTVEFQALDGDQRATLSTHHLDGDSTWSDSGALRVTIPADVHMLSFTITGTTAIVDDITLRDVTDVVRLEQAANANRQKAEQAIAKADLLELSLDGEGGLKDRLASAETVLETKADESALDQLDQKLAGNLAAFEAHYTRVWRQDTPPPAGTHYEWLGEPHGSVSVMLDNDGNETARNVIHDGNIRRGTGSRYVEVSRGRVNIAGDDRIDLQLYGQSDLIHRENAVYVLSFWAQKHAGTITHMGGHTVPTFMDTEAYMDGEYVPGRWASGISGLGIHDNEPHFFEVKLTAREIDAGTPMGNGGVYIQPNRQNFGPYYELELWDIALQSRPAEADELDSTYFDGSTASDRANDLWYNAEGVPHEWVNGEGWVELSDARITELANTVSAHATRLQTAETELGKKATTSALNALAGTVAGNTTAISEAQQTLEDAQDDLDTALTGPVDHDRLRAGTGAFNQAFIARLVADSVQAMSAEFEQLTVTELANFAQIIGDQIWAELAVFDRLDAREGYVGGAHLKDGAVTAEKMTITGDLAAAIVSADKARIAELISDEIWAELGVFDRLQAREGWIGGTLLADGAVTAEKITATRELITRIMGAEWAYIAQQLIVDGSILTRDLEALSAAIQSLTVTQRADIAELWAKELWTALAVIEELQAEEAWITSAMISELTAEKVTVTENFVGRVAELLHLVVDRIDVNSLWADQTWQAAGHFGSSSADQSTLVDGTGLRITKHDHQNETSTDIVRLGGEGIGLVFSDEQGEVTGSLSHEGDASFRDVTVESLTHGGRPLQDPECQDYVHPSGNQSLISWRPRAVVGRAETVLPNTVDTPYREYGFIETAAHLEAGRSYWLTVTPFLSRNAEHNSNYLRIRATTDGSHPTGNSPMVMNQRNVVGGNDQDILMHGTMLYTPSVTGVHRFMVSVYTYNGVRMTFSGQVVQFIVEDAGSAVPDGTVVRDTYIGHPSGNPDIIGPIQSADSITTEWHAQGYQNYSHNGTVRQTTNFSTSGYGAGGPTHGLRRSQPDQGRWVSFMRLGEGTNGQTLQQSLAGAEIQSITLEARGQGSLNDSNTLRAFFYAQPQTTAPVQYTSSNLGIPLFGGASQLFNVGQTRRINLPVETFGPLLKSGDFRSIGVWTSSDQPAYAGWLSWSADRPKLIISYTKEGT